MRQGYSKADRLLRRGEYVAVQRRGSRYQAPHLTLLVLASSTQRSRLGITVTTKIGGAVQRNRFKRMVREIYRRRREELPAGKDVVVIARRGAPELDYAALERELLELAERARSAARGRGGAA